MPSLTKYATLGEELDDAKSVLQETNEELETLRAGLIESLEDANATLKLAVEQLDHERQRAMQERSEVEQKSLKNEKSACYDNWVGSEENDLEALTEELAPYATQLDAHVQEVEDRKQKFKRNVQGRRNPRWHCDADQIKDQHCGSEGEHKEPEIESATRE
ncbi:hypothetical protein BS47DRAFT_1369990 [Hydnum rufescens UP504]|uniref:Uncharacterized protein n=1 Tax=Hydnum rufescens UP504 TaxID=1448309 RepID=A0A9P6DL80_9AGAM|nr:hypothetical protein BS47DRAFT_1369990 [Hydnum rufescens UP504]